MVVITVVVQGVEAATAALSQEGLEMSIMMLTGLNLEIEGTGDGLRG